jgi:HSP20 family protein
MRRFSEEMDRLFEDFGFGGSLLGPVARNDLFRGALSGAEQSLWSPQVEIFEREGQLVVRADLPGLTKDDVKVEVTDKFITISGERRQEHKENREGYYHTERSYGSFLRTVALPEGANAEDAKATFRNGVLEITLQAPQRAKGGRRVEISDGTEEHSQAQAARGAK